METRPDQIQEIFLVLRSQSGDRTALDELLKSIQAPLYRYISRLAGDEAFAEDVLQEVFLIIYRKIGWLREPKLFRPWIFRIASRETFARLKKERRWSDQAREDEVLNSIPAGEIPEPYDPDLVRQIPALLSAVSPASRAVLILHYIEELTLTETAEILGISTGTAKSRMAYGLETLRRAIDKRSL
jgi:RNA polymerase sigma-70 factor (ECF subfamily)